MKKLEKKLSYFTKVLLVLGLLFNNLSSLSIVFANEETENFSIALTEENDIVINYLSQIDDTDDVKAMVSENYTYLDDTSEAPVVNEHLFTGQALVAEDGVEITSQMLSNVLFDGLYEVSVSLYNETDHEELGTLVFSKNVVHESGLQLKLYDQLDNEIILGQDKLYHVDAAVVSDIEVIANVLPGGLKPTDEFIYNGEQKTAKELLEIEFKSDYNLVDSIYGEYTFPITATVSDLNLEEVNFNANINVSYEFDNETYPANADVLNSALSNFNEFGDEYVFQSNEKDGTVYVLTDETELNSVLELYSVVDFAVNGANNISFKISNSQYENIINAYEEAKLLDDTLVLDDFLDNIQLDNSMVLSLTSRDLTITYKVLLVGDLDEDGLLSQEDLELLIDETVKATEENNTDIYLDGELNTLDTVYLHQVLKNKSWSVILKPISEDIDARLQIVDNEIVSGDEFTVNYILNLTDFAVNGIAGLIDYDKTMFELVKVEAYNDWIGSNHDGSFLYLGNDGLMGITSEDDNQQPVVNPEEYTVLTVTFKALKAGNGTIKVTKPEFINQDSLYQLGYDEVSTSVIVDESSDNTLKSLTVSGQEIELIDGELEYKMTVENDVTSVAVEAIASNVAASISSIVAPEELAVGENTVTIVVMAENGDEKIYTVTITRKEAPKEENEDTVVNLNYPSHDDKDTTVEEKPVVKDEAVVEDNNDDKVEKESNLSRIIIVILILLVIAGLIYLIFRDDKDDKDSKVIVSKVKKAKKEKKEDRKESRKANKEINKLKKEEDFSVEKKKKNNKKSKNKKKRK